MAMKVQGGKMVPAKGGMKRPVDQSKLRAAIADMDKTWDAFERLRQSMDAAGISGPGVVANQKFSQALSALAHLEGALKELQ